MNDKYFDPILQDVLREELEHQQWWRQQDAEMARKESEALDWFRSQTKQWQDDFIADAIIPYLEDTGYWDGRR